MYHVSPERDMVKPKTPEKKLSQVVGYLKTKYRLTQNENRFLLKDFPSENEQNTENTSCGLDCPIASSEGSVVVDDDNVSTEPNYNR
ncbi:hypothetical protein TNCV_907861 [Trichonephila clavipes]|nr:hypothetical protein TNCV_907861 [Trichonephila clavipes]